MSPQPLVWVRQEHPAAAARLCVAGPLPALPAGAVCEIALSRDRQRLLLIALARALVDGAGPEGAGHG